MPRGIYKHKPLSEEHKQKLRVASIRNGNIPPSNLGKHHSDETKKKISISNTGKKLSREHINALIKFHTGRKQSPETIAKRVVKITGLKRTDKFKLRLKMVNTGKHPTEATRKKLRESHLGKHQSIETIEKRVSQFRGEKSCKWISDRTKLAKHQVRNDYAYLNWNREVKKRDNGRCRINNKDCAGHNEVHHILSWTDFPELRYNINNGITLCHAHHPRKRAEEKELRDYFRNLVQVSSV